MTVTQDSLDLSDAPTTHEGILSFVREVAALTQPDATPPVQLVRPKVFWEFADPALEQASAGEKLMVRIGPAHAARVRAKLAEVRVLLVAAPPAAG